MKLSKLTCAIALSNLAMGASMVHAAGAPTLTDVLGASGITMTGYVDTAYTHFDSKSSNTPPNYFDEGKSSFNLKQAAIQIAKQPAEGFGGLVNVTLGSDADAIKSFPYNGTLGSTTATNSVDVTQAFVQYASGPLTVIGGKFNTLAGAEVIAPNGNTNISRSLAFLNAIAFTHTGIRVSYMPVSSLTLYLGSNNGWDQQKDTNNGKTAELGASWTASDMVSAAVYAYSGGETPAVGADAQKRTLIDTVITVKPTKELALILNYDMGKQKDASTVKVGDAKWTAINLYVNYMFTDKLHGSLRLEQFDDKDGFKLGTIGGMAQKVKGYTYTMGYAAADNFELRGEIREDKSNQKAYMKDGSATDKQQYFAVEGLYKF